MRRGFSLIEFLLVAFILGVIVTIFLSGFSAFKRNSDLNAAVQDVITALRLARSKTLSSEGPSSWGVHIDPNQVVLFQGLNYIATASTNSVVSLPSSVNATSSFVSASSDVVFLRPEGSVSNYGTITIITNDGTNQRFIRVDQSGAISVGTQPPPTTPFPSQDTRHIHVVLGWDIRTNNNMRLIFKDPPNPDVIDQTPVSTCMNVANNVFDCTKSLNVGGKSQTVRVHTHTLGANTTLSINRDGRENTKAVEVWFDNTQIVIYDSSGNVTKGPDILVGQPQIQ
ncbi:prepilin-type N-terminal cleavage/methylation domain-containing protein [Candidatus Parcubacteria bacterium]|nr:MAG: prepilin-type N-terminal cleavage/methylation domain-containing protein [Candidatus Parcubacteria bacterium]